MITYAIDGVPLDDAGGRWKLLAGTQVGSGASRRTAEMLVPGMDGSLPPTYEALDAPTLLLKVRIYGTTYGNLMANYSALVALLAPGRDATVTRTVDGVARTTVGRGKTVSDPEFSPSRKTATITATLRLPRVSWRAAAGDWSQAAPVSGTAYEVTTLAGSTAPVDDALLLLTGPVGAGGQVACRGEWLRLGAAVPAGSSALVDCAAWTVRIGTGVSFTGGGTLTAGVLTNSGGPAPLRLVPQMRAADPVDTQVVVTLTATGLTGSSAIGVRARTAHLA